MAFPTSFDELNRLVGYERSMPIAQYFDEMQITKEQKRLRKAFANRLENEMVWLMSFLFYSRNNPMPVQAIDEITQRYTDELRRYVPIDEYIAAHIATTTADLVGTTSRHKDDSYFYSKDRARLIAENESNMIFSHTEYADAVKNKSYKQWLTIIDGHERESHAEVNGVIMPINEPFMLQGGMAQFPRDTSYGISDDEIVGCRCSLKFF